MARKYVVKVATGKYNDAQGVEKTKYAEIGSILDGKNGFILKIDLIPVGWDGWGYLNVPEVRTQGTQGQGAQRGQQAQQGRQQTQQQKIPAGGGFEQMDDDSDIPF